MYRKLFIMPCRLLVCKIMAKLSLQNENIAILVNLNLN